MLSGTQVGMYYTAPIIALFYFLSTQHQIQVTYYMFVYYYVGNFIFGLIVYILVASPVDTPIRLLMHLEKDYEDATKNRLYNLGSYLKNFQDVGGMQLYEEERGGSAIRLTMEQADAVLPLYARQSNQGLSSQKEKGGAPSFRVSNNLSDRNTAATGPNRDTTQRLLGTQNRLTTNAFNRPTGFGTNAGDALFDKDKPGSDKQE
jgi:hypothetical protein